MRDTYHTEDLAVIANLMEIGEGYMLTSISLSVGGKNQYRGKGRATQLLQTILNDADREGAVLMLNVEPSFGEGNLTGDQLRRWYERHGFVPLDGSECGMIRQPNQIVGAE